MENFCAEPTKKRLLLCSNLDNESVAKLSEKYVPQNPQLDAIIAVGPFHCTQEGTFTSKEEEDASKIADIGSIVAQLENIVCRVIYLPSQKDPNCIITKESHLTPNSVTIHGRKLMLTRNLYISGFSEPDLTAEATELPNEEGVYESLEEIRLQSAKSMDVLRDIIRMETVGGNESHSTTVPTGIFALLYHFSHTLNHFLFHLTDELESAGVDLCIIGSGNQEEVSRLPKKFGNLNIVSAGNLQQGQYTLVDMEFDSLSNRWKTVAIEYSKL